MPLLGFGGIPVNAGPLSIAYINIQDQKAQNTAGGTFTNGADRTRDLNTVVSDTANICSLASNQFTLPAGTYRIHARAPAYTVGPHQAMLWSVTDNAVQNSTKGFPMRGSVGRSDAGVAVMGQHSVVSGQFTIDQSKTFEIRHRCTTTASTDGFGPLANFGTEVYTVVELWRESAVGLTFPTPIGTTATIPYVNVTHTLAQNTAGGTFSNGAWQTRPLNTITTDTNSIASLSSNQIVLPAGTYAAQFAGVGHQCDRLQGRLQNVTDATTLILGVNTFSGVSGTQEVLAHGFGRFTLASAKTIEFQQRCQTSRSTDGFGTPGNWGSEVYASVEFWKIL